MVCNTAVTGNQSIRLFLDLISQTHSFALALKPKEQSSINDEKYAVTTLIQNFQKEK
jgi:hypothetical protein